MANQKSVDKTLNIRFDLFWERNMRLIHYWENVEKRVYAILIKIIEKRYGYTETKDRLIYNINWDPSRRQKRVLIAYLDLSMTGNEIIRGSRHTNRYELYKIILFFIQKDYVLDICHCNDVNAIECAKKQKYDVIFGLGHVFRKMAETSDAYKILYLTENPYSFSYKKEMERITYFYNRHHIKISFARTGHFFYKSDEELADAVICLGDPKQIRMSEKDVIRIWPSAMINDNYFDISKRNRKNFLVLGTDGFVHKGIDLLLEVFAKHSDWNLFLCGSNIKKTIKKLKYPAIPANIHDCGFVNVYSDSFLRYVETCTFILLPSCSEASPTAILTGMCHGLLPIIMNGQGMDEMDEYCYYFENYDLASIERKLNEVIELSQDECIDRAYKVMDYARNKFTLENFQREIYHALSSILEKDRTK